MTFHLYLAAASQTHTHTLVLEMYVQEKSKKSPSSVIQWIDERCVFVNDHVALELQSRSQLTPGNTKVPGQDYPFLDALSIRDGLFIGLVNPSL